MPFAVATLRSRNRPSGTSGERCSRLDPEEGRQERDGEGQQPKRPHGGPTRLVAVDDGVDGEHQRGGHGDRAGDVEASRIGWSGGRWQHEQRGDADRDTDGKIDEEDPVPAQRAGQDAAEQDADAATARGDEAEEAHRPCALAWLGEEVHRQRETDRRDDGAAQTLDRPRADQHRLRLRQATAERGQREDGDTNEEEPPVAEEVAEPATQQQEAAEGEQIGVHDPGQRGWSKAEVRANGGQRDIHDSRIEHDHETAQAEDDQREPACAAIGAASGHVFPSSVPELGRRVSAMVGVQVVW